MEFKGYIYKITSPSGKIYIGQTTNIYRRLKYYRNKHKNSQPKLDNSINKYGWNNHIFEVIEKVRFCGLNNWLLDLLETYWIEELNSVKNGLNCTYGGRGSKGFKHTEESIVKMKEKLIGQKRSDDFKKKTSERLRGNKHSLGRKYTEESKQKLREIKKNVTSATREKMAMSQQKAVLCIENNTIYPSIKNARTLLGMKSNRSLLLDNGLRKDLKTGLHFKYLV